MNNNNENGKGVFSPPVISERTLAVIEERVQDPHSGLATGIDPIIDKILLPMRPGELIGILGYTSNYKTGLMNFIARHHAKRLQGNGNTKQAVVSVLWEQSIEEQGVVDIAQLIHLDATKMMRGELDAEGIVKLKKGAEERGKLPWWLIGHSVMDSKRRPRMSMSDVAHAMDVLTEEVGIEPILINLDYLQRIRREKNDMREGYMEIVDRAKDMSLSLSAPVILGCQAKRDVKRREWKVPQQDDAQETSNFEQTCDKLISLWMPKNDMPLDQPIKIAGKMYDVTENMLLLQVLKQKFGPAPRLFRLHVKPEVNEIHAQTLDDVRREDYDDEPIWQSTY